MQIINKILTWTMIIGFLFLPLACAKKSNVIKIACAAPFTGDQVKIGIDLLNGVRLAVDEANEKGDVIPGHRLVIVEGDDQAWLSE